MSRTVGGGPRPAGPRPQQQLSRALGAPQARPAGGAPGRANMAGRVHRDPNGARNRSQAQTMLLNRQRVANAPGSLGGSTIDVGRYFGEAAGQGGGMSGNLKCADCGTGLIAGYDAMGNPDGPGHLCKNCWADMWVPHPHGNVSGLGGNTCTMGVRWTPQEWGAIQQFAFQAINMTGAALGRAATANDYPRIKAALDPVLGANFKRSMKCTSCHADISFEPTADDIPMAGINVAAQ